MNRNDLLIVLVAVVTVISVIFAVTVPKWISNEYGMGPSIIVSIVYVVGMIVVAFLAKSHIEKKIPGLVINIHHVWCDSPIW